MDTQQDVPVGGEGATTAPEFSWRATRVLAILGLLALLAGPLIALLGDRSPGQLVTAAAASLGSFGCLGLAMALRAGRPWAIGWAKVSLLIVAAVGIGHSVIALPGGTLWIPLDTLAAVWALLAGDHTPPDLTRLRPGGLVLLALIVLAEAAGPLGTAAAGLTKPLPDPNAVIVVENRSPRAVVVTAGNLLVARTDLSVAAACGGIVKIQIRASDYQSDGRLMAMIAIDKSGQLDAWTATAAQSETFGGSNSMIPIWSRGDLAGTLPLRLVVHRDLTVDTSPSSPAGCTPNPSALPAGG